MEVKEEVPGACRLVRTWSKFGEFNLKLLMTKQMARRFSFVILSKKKKKLQTKERFLCNK